jgi:adenosylcobinamide-GDP ribazoletransferase
MRPLITALRTLTCIPVPGSDTISLASSLPFFPAVGALVGVIVAGTLYGLTLVGWTAGAGISAMVVVLWITRGLHVDGLADATDALGGGRTRERRLEIMKDPHTGAFGVMAIVADLLLKSFALAQLASLHQWALVVIPFIASRTGLVMLSVSLPYARPEGGKAGGFVEGARPLHLVLSLLAAAAFCLATAGLAGLVLLLQGLAIVILLRMWMRHHFGGVTGDLLGTANEVVETGLLVFLAFISPVAGLAP